MRLRDEVLQLQKFDTAIAEVIDSFLKEGMDPDEIRECLNGHLVSDLHGRQRELEEA